MFMTPDHTTDTLSEATQKVSSQYADFVSGHAMPTDMVKELTADLEGISDIMRPSVDGPRCNQDCRMFWQDTKTLHRFHQMTKQLGTINRLIPRLDIFKGISVPITDKIAWTPLLHLGIQCRNADFVFFGDRLTLLVV